MIVHQPEIKYHNDEIILFAKIEYDHQNHSLPEKFWFSFPKDYAPFLTKFSDPFAVALIQTSQYLGENLEIRGSTSERLAYGLQQYGMIFHLWNPKWFDPPRLKFEKISQEKPSEQRIVATAFSGGVDSFYTLMHHLPQWQPLPSYQVSAGLLIHGMEIRFFEAQKYELIYSVYKEMFNQLGLDLLRAKMNGYLFWEHRLRWEYVHGAPLVATALCLSNKISRFYIPATHSYDYLLHNGTSPITDHWLSTELVDIIHHGSQQSRMGKIEEIAHWEYPQRYLRVCTDVIHQEGINNCSKCNKCLRTMLMLDQFGVLNKFTTFSKKITPASWFKYILTAPGGTYPKQLFQYAKRKKSVGKMILAWFAIQTGRFHRYFSEHIVNILSKEQLYKVKHRIYYKNREKAIQ
ncbi:MAG: hypothetical protein ACPL0B_00950 [Anaerolineales bacterium]